MKEKVENPFFAFLDIDVHYQSLYLNPETSNRNVRCVISHISLDQPKEVSLVINFSSVESNSNSDNKEGGVIDIFVGIFALLLLGAFFMVLLAW